MRSWIRILQIHSRDDGYLLLDGFERLQRRRKRVQRVPLWNPWSRIETHGDVHVPESPQLAGCSRCQRLSRHGGNHCVEQWQADGHTSPSQQSSTRQSILHSDHGAVLIRKGLLATIP